MKRKVVLCIGVVLLLSAVNIGVLILPVGAAVNVQRNSFSENSIIVKSVNTDPIYELLIIAPEKFTSKLQPLVVHKNDVAEVSTILVTTSEIYDGDYFLVEGRDRPEKIKYFIKNAYDNWGIKYVLLVGDFRCMPVRYIHNEDLISGYPEPEFISDFYYADVYDENGSFSSWDTDNDEIFGEWYYGEVAEDQPIDLYPDVCVGRLACRNTNEVKAVTNKIITYETNTYDTSWFKKIIGVSGDSYPGIPGIEGEENVLRIFKNFSDDWTKISLFTSDGSFSGVWDVIRAVNNGAGLLYMEGHASPFTWGTNKPGGGMIHGPDLITMSFMLNGKKLPVLVTTGCHNFQFDVNFWKILEDPSNWMTWLPECWGWKFTRMAQGGSIASIGTTGLGYSKEDKASGEGCSDFLNQQIFYEYANVQSSDVLGELWAKSLSNYLDEYPIDWNAPAFNVSAIDAKTVQQWVLFGDPSLKIGGYDVEGGGSEFEAESVVASAFENVRSASNAPAQPATAPDTPLGPTSGEPGTEYTFTAHITTSPSYDQICYFFDWGDETYSGPVGPYPRDRIAEANHVWSDASEYEVRVKAWLINSESDWLTNLESDDYWAETDWSDTTTITISKDQQINQQSSSPLFFQMLQRLANIR